MTEQERAEIEKALREQMKLLRRASENMANKDKYYTDDIMDLCRLSEALVSVVRSFPGESSSVLP